ncbi:D-alanyl-D-alanine carboxypeptidase [Gleimia hominis]|uniref:D-alanyl-D-alanine carboxypeptidase n=1 Tax=Gleimia hominis TaxID=595468 RepID=A0ABU3I9J2_9ACTO|nr:D-alanyl-D-alanine carboxypeptidase [Gleimia hominis]MDT3767044.1 D-alanyl-D-alanine carboxypeptidase [Gleimia hominis]
MGKRLRIMLVGAATASVLVGGYAVADAFDIVPGFITTQRPPVGAPPPTPSTLSADPNLPTHMELNLPPISGKDLSKPWQNLQKAAKDGKYTPAAYVVDALTGNVLLDGNGRKPLTPASTTKLLTAVQIAKQLKATETLKTTVWQAANGDLHLVGEGDLMLAEDKGNSQAVVGRAGLGDLAEQVVKNTQKQRTPQQTRGTQNPAESPKGKNTEESPKGNTPEPEQQATKLIYHDAIFDGAAREKLADGLTRWVGPAAAFGTDTGNSEGKYTSADDPGADAAKTLAKQLEQRGIKVDVSRSATPFTVGTPGEKAKPQQVGQVESAPIAALTRRMLEYSDNTWAEQLCRLSAQKAGKKSDVSGAAQLVHDTISKHGVYSDGLVLHDCSGLNDANKIAPRTTVEVLRSLWNSEDPQQRTLSRSLSVGHFVGTLEDRLDKAPAARVVAKTGSLDTVSAIAGYATTKSGRVLVFAVQAADAEEGAYIAREDIDAFIRELISL